MSNIIVSGNTLHCNGRSYRCAIGKNGFSRTKKEGDGTTPIGTFPLRECWYRMDRLEAPRTKLPLRLIRPEDGWCDDPASADYNTHVRLPYEASHEKLFRDEHVYDLIIPLGYNDDPVIAGKGSAIFMHIAKPGYNGTEGCIALAEADLLEILGDCGPSTTITIAAE